LHTVRQSPHLALFPRHSLLSQHSQHRRSSESPKQYPDRQCIVIEARSELQNAPFHACRLHTRNGAHLSNPGASSCDIA
jgi:hypothetical protein